VCVCSGIGTKCVVLSGFYLTSSAQWLNLCEDTKREKQAANVVLTWTRSKDERAVWSNVADAEVNAAILDVFTCRTQYRYTTQYTQHSYYRH